MLVQSILLGLVGVFCALDSRLLGRLNFERPLIGSTLVGLILGDLQTGLVVGASLELMSLGIVNIGAAAPPNMNMASIIAAAFAIFSNANAETALTIAVPISVLGQMLDIVLRTFLSNFSHRADTLIEQGQFAKARRIHIGWGTLLYGLSYFIPIFMAIYFGTDLVQQLVDVIPDWLTDGLGVASKILPAFGFALLLNTMLTNRLVPYLLLGFLITAYSGLDVTGIALFACIVAFIMYEVKFSGNGGNGGSSEEADPLEDDL